MKSQFEPTTVQQPDSVGGSARSRVARVARAVHRIEPAVGVTVALATGWRAATTNSELPWLWLFCLFALGIACWAGWRRSVAQFEIAARGLALLAAGLLLHTYGGVPGGAAGVYFFWLGLPALYYVFVLKAPYASLIAVAAVAEFTLAALWIGGDTLSSLAVQGAYLLIVPMLVAMKLGSLARRRSPRAGDARTDRSTALYNRSGLLTHGRELLAHCRAERRELTLAVFDCGDLLEARSIYGNRTSRKLVDTIVRKLGLLAGGQGLAARTGPTQFAVAMPMSRDKAVQAIERLLGNPTRFELEGSKSEIVLVPHVMVEVVPAAGTVERMFAALCRGLVRVQEEERMRQRYLQRERERHSRPMLIAAEAPVARPSRVPRLDPDPVVVHQIPNTIPMPLSAR
ncbi:diguanylate cyclase domain-containing protein [Caenimonas terrae]|uniref:Diguanylate cyclase domain-containing protein n=1 Tax=Caenimonas terrae TaxID=696074 RepID=A0ABW0NI21_9BURK